MKLSIRFKLLAIGIIAIFSAAMSVFIVSLKEHQTIYAESVKVNLAALAANTADDLLLLMSEKSDPFLLRSVLLRFERYDDIKYAILYDHHWQQAQAYLQPRLFSAVKDGKMMIPEIPPEKLPLHVSVQDDGIFVMQPIGENGHVQGYLLLAHEYREPLKKSRTELLRLSLVPLISILIISIGAMLLIIRQQLVPLLNLSSFTRQLSSRKDYSERFPIMGDDEVYTLAQDINAFLGVIDSEIKANHEKAQLLTEQKEAMYRLANYDQLTGLPNRRYIMSCLAELLANAQQNNEKITLMYFDVDHFKGVNDRMGHEVGDKLLIEVGKLVSRFLSADQVLARLAGDEFLVVIPNLSNKLDAVNLANQMTAELSLPIHIERWNIQTGISIGIADTSDAGYHVDDLISYADVAMYHTKHYTKGGVTVFHPEMLQETQRRSMIINAIADAAHNSEFKLFYQPKISSTGEVLGLEALIRWENAALGTLLPSEFIPIAEASGKISNITRWILDQIVRDLPDLMKASHANIVVSFNISSHDLDDNWLTEYLQELIQQKPDVVKHLQFEITETSYLKDFNKANRFFSMVRESGSSVALDDFGTGFSSLSYLSKIDIDTIKIDRTFIHHAIDDKRNRAVLHLILDLSYNLGLQTCCEGVESAEQAKYLVLNGCNIMQGFYFSSAMPLEDLSETITTAQQRYQEIELFC